MFLNIKLVNCRIFVTFLSLLFNNLKKVDTKNVPIQWIALKLSNYTSLKGLMCLKGIQTNFSTILHSSNSLPLQIALASSSFYGFMGLTVFLCFKVVSEKIRSVKMIKNICRFFIIL